MNWGARQRETLTIYGNGYQLAQVKDNKYSQGRLGVFVRAVNTSNYTFRLTRLAYWILNTPNKRAPIKITVESHAKDARTQRKFGLIAPVSWRSLRP